MTLGLTRHWNRGNYKLPAVTTEERLRGEERKTKKSKKGKKKRKTPKEAKRAILRHAITKITDFTVENCKKLPPLRSDWLSRS